MVMTIHDNTQLPLIDMAGMYLGPGQHHKLSYTKKINQFLPSPYTKCNNQVNRGTQLVYNHFGGIDYGYSQFMCFTVCTQTYT